MGAGSQWQCFQWFSVISLESRRAKTEPKLAVFRSIFRTATTPLMVPDDTGGRANRINDLRGRAGALRRCVAIFQKTGGTKKIGKPVLLKTKEVRIPYISYVYIGTTLREYIKLWYNVVINRFQ